MTDRDLAHAQMIALLRANIRAGELRAEAMGRSSFSGVLRGAPTHSGAYLLNALREQGWELRRIEPSWTEG